MQQWFINLIAIDKKNWHSVGENALYVIITLVLYEEIYWCLMLVNCSFIYYELNGVQTELLTSGDPQNHWPGDGTQEKYSY